MTIALVSQPNSNPYSLHLVDTSSSEVCPSPKTSTPALPMVRAEYAHARTTYIDSLDIMQTQSVRMQEEVRRIMREALLKQGVELLVLNFHDTVIEYAVDLYDVKLSEHENVLAKIRKVLGHLRPQPKLVKPRSITHLREPTHHMKLSVDRPLTSDDIATIQEIFETRYTHVLTSPPRFEKNTIRYDLNLKDFSNKPETIVDANGTTRQLGSPRATILKAIKGDILVALAGW